MAYSSHSIITIKESSNDYFKSFVDFGEKSNCKDLTKKNPPNYLTYFLV